jgi:DNA-binding NarL/FixJ family response regulator
MRAAEAGTERSTSPSAHAVVVVEPLAVVRAGLVRTIAADRDLEVMGDAANAEEALALLERTGGTGVVILVATGLSGDRDAFWLIRAIRERFSSHVILGLGAEADPPVISRALFVGADGFIDKAMEVDRFTSAILRAAAGDVVIAGPAAGEVGRIADGIERRRTTAFRLTDREREVLTVAAEGLTAREIADRLGVSERTVTTHLARIYGKLGVTTRLGALRVAARSGLVSLGLDG